MAATVGATIASTTFPSRVDKLGPYKSSAGNIYVVLRSSANTITVQKATDPMTSFSQAQSWLVNGTTGFNVQCISVFQVGDILHVLCHGSISNVFYRQFDMSNDTWAIAAESLGTATNGVTSGYSFCSMVVRSTGEVVMCYSSGLSASMSGFERVGYKKRSAGGTWDASATAIDNGGSVNWSNPIAVLGASDRVHFFFTDDTNDDVYQRTLSAANALQTFPSALDTTADTNFHLWASGVAYVSGGTTKVRAPYADSGGTVSVAKLDSADAPTVTLDTGVGGVASKVTNNQRMHALAVDGTTVHLVYSDATASDLQHDLNANDAGWGAETNELAGTLNAISANVYDRSGTKLAMVIDDNATIKYAEVELTAAVVEQVIHRSSSAYTYY